MHLINSKASTITIPDVVNSLVQVVLALQQCLDALLASAQTVTDLTILDQQVAKIIEYIQNSFEKEQASYLIQQVCLLLTSLLTL